MSHQETKIYRSSETGRLLEEVKKEIKDSVRLYFSPLTAVAREFSKKTGMSGQDHDDCQKMKHHHAR